MKVLMISGDINILKEGSDACARLQLQRAQVDRLDVFVWPQVHSLRTVCKAVREQQYDVITAQDPFWRGHLAWHLSRRAHAKLNIQVHTDLAAQSWWRLAWAAIQLRHADSVRVVSEKIRRQVVGMGVRAPVRVLPVFVDIHRFKEVKPMPHKQKTILWVGRFEKEKDPLAAVQVLRDVRAAGVDAKMVMLGAGGLESELQRLTKELPIEFPGWRDPVHYLPVADLVLSTSLHESWGASMVEALAAGVPVVAPDVGVAKEAGAIIADRAHLADEVATVLQAGIRGELVLALPSREQWAELWKESLT